MEGTFERGRLDLLALWDKHGRIERYPGRDPSIFQRMLQAIKAGQLQAFARAAHSAAEDCEFAAKYDVALKLYQVGQRLPAVVLNVRSQMAFEALGKTQPPTHEDFVAWAQEMRNFEHNMALVSSPQPCLALPDPRRFMLSPCVRHGCSARSELESWSWRRVTLSPASNSP